ncbi:glycerophosphodiester phosphodiesterase [Cellulosilyticum sp. I15G10I2]|uniref:glycerophosphodiester phosphodiesterase n=1 Tax=Cellulosilyticum sp. I15G10I2 TaxID=1892843 RepID=UPI00085C7056|nr:glycerophosphodiester phosphodiesterase family protein [Cellulosilyticum sp. I15G10I2]
MDRVLNVAHRGFSGKYPENTNIAFVKALTEGYCDGIEVDVHMTKDGKLVIIHDSRLERTTTGTGFIKDYTLEEVLQFDAGVKYDPKYKGEKISLVDVALDLVKKYNVRLYIEIKNSEDEYKGIEEKIVEKVKEFGLQDKVVLHSYNGESVKRVKLLDDRIKTGLLCREVSWDIRDYRYADAICFCYESADLEAIETIHSIGKKVTVWTVDEISDMKKMIDLGVDAIITNYPDTLNDIINGLC